MTYNSKEWAADPANSATIVGEPEILIVAPIDVAAFDDWTKDTSSKRPEKTPNVALFTRPEVVAPVCVRITTSAVRSTTKGSARALGLCRS